MGLRDRSHARTPRPGHGARDGDRRARLDGIGALRRKLVDEVDLEELSELDQTQRRARLERIVGSMLSREGPILSPAQRTSLIRQVVDEALGLGVLEPLLADESVTEIMVNGPRDVWIERDGRIERVDNHFAGEVELYQTIDRIVSTVNRRVDESSPMVDARLPGGERVNVIIPPLALTGPTITIRRFPRLYTMAQLRELGTLDEPMAALLDAMVQARLSIVISGGTGAGKTTLLNALSGSIPRHERIITVEDSAELRLQQPHVVSLEARPSNVEGKGEIRIRDLVRNSLRMRPDRIIVGEVRGPETLDMLQAMNTGHEGSLVTVHANSVEDAMARLETLSSMSDVDVPFAALREQINGAIDVVIQLDRGPDGGRRMTEIAVLDSRHRSEYQLFTVSRFAAQPIGPDRRVRGEQQHFGLPERVRQRLVLAGKVPPDAFDRDRDGEPPAREAR